MARKKVVLVIVEGASDSTALEFLFDKIFEQDLVHVRIMHCDITTENGVLPSNILSKIGNIVKAEGERNHFTRSNLKEVIHIVDTDGAYIDDEHIEEDLTCKDIIYSDNGIRTNKRDAVIKRNEQKRENLNKICETTTVFR